MGRILNARHAGQALGIDPRKTPAQLAREIIETRKRELINVVDFSIPARLTTVEALSDTNAKELTELYWISSILAYERLTKEQLQRGFNRTYVGYPWLYACPEAVTKHELKIVKIVCPSEQWDSTDFIPLKEQPHYYAQIQTEMACLGIVAAEFFQWSPHGYMLEFVPFDAKWWRQNFPLLQKFYLDKLLPGLV